MGKDYNVPLDADIKGGLLYSMKEREMNTINITRDTVVGLLRKRNELVSYIVSNKLPPMLRLENTCKRCFSADKCTIYGKVRVNESPFIVNNDSFTVRRHHRRNERYGLFLHRENQTLEVLASCVFGSI